MAKKDAALEEIRKMVKIADSLPIVMLPQFLQAGGSILPGIGPGGQMLTREEMNALSDEEAMQYRFRYVMLAAPRNSTDHIERSGKRIKTA